MLKDRRVRIFGVDRPVLSIPAVSFESLRTNGWDVEACAELSRSRLALPNHASDP